MTAMSDSSRIMPSGAVLCARVIEIDRGSRRVRVRPNGDHQAVEARLAIPGGSVPRFGDEVLVVGEAPELFVIGEL